jgi:hypothetical protein
MTLATERVAVECELERYHVMHRGDCVIYLYPSIDDARQGKTRLRVPGLPFIPSDMKALFIFVVPDREISGVIVAGSIDSSLKQACTITNNVSLKIYRVSLELEDV